MRLSEEERAYFKACSDELLEHHLVQSMSRYEQHGTTNRLDHSVQVAQYSYWVSKKLKLKLDQKSLIRGALLHDFFLYDWRTGTDHEGAHAFTHPETALSNAIEHFEINEKEADIILNHMWPLTITKMPSCKESFLVSAIDKYCSLTVSCWGKGEPFEVKGKETANNGRDRFFWKCSVRPLFKYRGGRNPYFFQR